MPILFTQLTSWKVSEAIKMIAAQMNLFTLIHPNISENEMKNDAEFESILYEISVEVSRISVAHFQSLF